MLYNQRNRVVIERVTDGYIITSEMSRSNPVKSKTTTRIATTIQRALGIAYGTLLPEVREIIEVEDVWCGD